MTDLQAKYQRLAAEFSKLRAQIPVLKKAVVDEKAVQDAMTQDLKEKEQSIRKSDQEIESLTFRNDQLSKRVSFLQQELEESRAIKKKYKRKDDHEFGRGQNNVVFSEELQGKIEENARLHKRLTEDALKYEQRIQELESVASHRESESSTHKQQLAIALAKHKEQVDKLLEDKAMLEVKLSKVESLYQDALVKAETLESSRNQRISELKTGLIKVENVLNTNLPFVDNDDEVANRLNIPNHDRRHQSRIRDLTTHSQVLVRHITSALSNFLTYTEHRVRIYPLDETSDTISQTNAKLCTYLNDHAQYTRSVDHALQQLVDTVQDDKLCTPDTSQVAQVVGSSVHRLSQYINTILPYLTLSLQEECIVSSCPIGLEKKNSLVIASLQHFVSCFEQIDIYLSLLTSPTQVQDLRPMVYLEIFSKLSTSAARLAESVRDLSKKYNSKVSVEHQLPTATQKLKVTDECIISSLVSLVTSSSKLSAFISTNLQTFMDQANGSDSSNNLPFISTNMHPAVMDFRQTTLDYLTTLVMPIPESVPYKRAIQNQHVLLSSSESKHSLATQLNAVKTQLSELAQEKERCYLELELLKIKYEREIERNTLLEKQKTGESFQTDSIHANIDRSSRESRAYSDLSMGSDTIPTDPGTVESFDNGKESNESLMKSHYISRIDELIGQLQMADSKAVYFHAEAKAIHQRFILSEKARDSAIEDSKTATETLTHITDELNMTTKSYESQLTMMSEHLAGMNDKLAEQKEEIDHLRSHLNPRDMKKYISGLKK